MTTTAPDRILTTTAEHSAHGTPAPLTATHPRPHVLIIGGGFAGLSAARELGNEEVDVTLIDRTNHHLFQPLLYQVATATLAPSDISVPIRWVVRSRKNVTVLLGEVDRVDAARKRVHLCDGKEVCFDYLLVATGARHSYFGNDQWEPLAPGLKTLDDALDIRRRFLMSFELAEKAESATERDACQTFVVIGGGPTGVELAGIIPPIARDAFREDFRRIDTRRTRVILIEGGPRVLAAFPEDLSARALRDLEKIGVEVRTKSVVTRVERDAVYIGEERIPTRNVFWAAGNAASPLAKSLGVETDRASRVKVLPDLSIPGHPDIFVVGDVAAMTSQDGSPVPGVAPAANQSGSHAAKNILRTIRKEERRPFRYFNKGNLATIGRAKAVAQFGKFKFGGFFAWFLWLFVHIMYLVGFRNRLSVLLQWVYAYLTYQRGVRLITGAERDHSEAPAPDRSAAPVPGWR